MTATLTVAALIERGQGERRVALVPDTVTRLVAGGYAVLIETGAGAGAFHPDDEYVAAGAKTDALESVLDAADVILAVRRPEPEILALLRPGQVLVGLLDARGTGRAGLDELVARGVVVLSLDLLPRTLSRAQTMDALSSQASVAGYRAAIVAAEAFARYFPMMMTAAGTARPAKVLVLGAGVAGLQAIGTARRLGAQVSGYDVRPAAREEVTSLGAAFLTTSVTAGAGEGGYGRGQERRTEGGDLLAGGRTDVVAGHLGAEPARGADRLESGHTRAEDQHGGGPRGAGRGDHHREVAPEGLRGDDHRAVAGDRGLRRQHVHGLRAGQRARQQVEAQGAHATIGQRRQSVGVHLCVEQADEHLSGAQLRQHPGLRATHCEEHVRLCEDLRDGSDLRACRDVLVVVVEGSGAGCGLDQDLKSLGDQTAHRLGNQRHPVLTLRSLSQRGYDHCRHCTSPRRDLLSHHPRLRPHDSRTFGPWRRHAPCVRLARDRINSAHPRHAGCAPRGTPARRGGHPRRPPRRPRSRRPARAGVLPTDPRPRPRAHRDRPGHPRAGPGSAAAAPGPERPERAGYRRSPRRAASLLS